MKLIILSPTKQKTMLISWLEIDTPVGNFIIQQGHAPTILPLLSNSKAIIRLRSGKQEIIHIPSGVAKIDRLSATLLLES